MATVLGSVTKVFDTLWITRSASGAKVANSSSLRAAQLVIENSSPTTQFLKWALDPNAAGVERWIAIEDTSRVGRGRMMARGAAPAAAAAPDAKPEAAAAGPFSGSGWSSGFGSFAGFGKGFVSPFKKP